jgi:hypothetical protein
MIDSNKNLYVLPHGKPLCVYVSSWFFNTSVYPNMISVMGVQLTFAVITGLNHAITPVVAYIDDVDFPCGLVAEHIKVMVD